MSLRDLWEVSTGTFSEGRLRRVVKGIPPDGSWIGCPEDAFKGTTRMSLRGHAWDVLVNCEVNSCFRL